MEQSKHYLKYYKTAGSFMRSGARLTGEETALSQLGEASHHLLGTKATTDKGDIKMLLLEGHLLGFLVPALKTRITGYSQRKDF